MNKLETERSSKRMILALGLAVGTVLSGSPFTETAAAELSARIVFSTYLGGGSEDIGRGVVVESSGRIHVAGSTLSRDFPVVAGTGNPEGDAERQFQDIFLVHLEADGGLVLSTYGTDAGFSDFAEDLALGSSGEDWMAGVRYPGDSSNFDLFLARNLEVVHRYEGEGYDVAEAVAVAPDGSVRMVTRRCDMRSCEGFLVLWSPGETRVVSLGVVIPADVAVDAQGDIWVAGSVSLGGYDAWVAKLDPAGTMLLSRRLGGSNFEEAAGLAVDSEGSVYVTGRTTSSDFPIRGGVQGSPAGSDEVFVAKLDRLGELVYSTYLGGKQSDFARDIAVSPSGEAVVTGGTWSPDFPLKGAIDDSCDGECLDVFVSRLDPFGSRLEFSTFLGGTSLDIGYAVALDPQGEIVVTGLTYSGDFPVVNAAQPEFGGSPGTGDAFVTKISPGSGNEPPDCSQATASPSVIWPPNGKMVPVSILGVTDPEGEEVGIEITGITQDEPGAAFSGIGSSVARVKAERDGKGDGRVYHLRFQAIDPEGSACDGEVTVCVPHDGRSASCGDGGVPVDSTPPRRRSAALVWSTYLGGSGDEVKLTDIEIDASGHAWIAGTTASDVYTGVMDFPYPDEDENYFLDAFASRLDPEGKLVRSMFLDGEPYRDEYIEGLAISPSGVVSFTGLTDDAESQVITTNIRPDGPVNSFNYYDGEGTESSSAVTTDRVGNVYMAGNSASHYFPGFGDYHEDGVGSYVMKLSPDHDYVYLDLFFLQDEVILPTAIALDSTGNIYLAGVTPTWGPASNVRVVKVDPSGNLVWKATFGGSQADFSTSLKVDSAGRAWVAGWTASPDFPVRGGRLYAGGRDAFLVRLTPDGVVDVSTLLGGSGTDEAHDLALDAGGRPYLTGLTSSSDFPRAGALPGSCGATVGCGAGSDAFAAAFDLFQPSRLGLTFATRLGGGGTDQAYGVAVDPMGSFLWLAGLTDSADFPTRNPWQPALAGERDVFVTKIALDDQGKGSRK